MQYKVLLAGNNEFLMDDLFRGMDEKFTFQTTSCRMEDVLGHFQTFQPDVLLYCMQAELPDRVKGISLALARFLEREVPVIIVGDAQDNDLYVQVSGETAGMVLSKNLKAEMIRLKMVGFLGEGIKHAGEPIKMSAPVEKEKTMDFELSKPPKTDDKASGGNFNFEDYMASLLEPQVEDTADEGGPRKEKHILVIDDDVRMLKTLKEQLHSEYDVATAVSGKIAFRFLANKTTDLIILDYEMPEEDGPTILAKLRENPATKDIPVIFLTGITKKDKIEKALVMKPQGYLLKPVNHKKLMTTIERIFNGA